MSGFVLFNNQTANGDSEILKADAGGIAHIRTYGTFDGATVQIEISFNDSNYVPLENGEFSEAGLKLIKLKTGERLKLVLSNVGTTDISADAIAPRTWENTSGVLPEGNVVITSSGTLVTTSSLTQVVT